MAGREAKESKGGLPASRGLLLTLSAQDRWGLALLVSWPRSTPHDPPHLLDCYRALLCFHSPQSLPGPSCAGSEPLSVARAPRGVPIPALVTLLLIWPAAHQTTSSGGRDPTWLQGHAQRPCSRNQHSEDKASWVSGALTPAHQEAALDEAPLPETSDPKQVPGRCPPSPSQGRVPALSFQICASQDHQPRSRLSCPGRLGSSQPSRPPIRCPGARAVTNGDQNPTSPV